MNKCKWCGGNDVGVWLVERGNSIIAYYIRCNNCGMKTKKYRDKAFAIDEWNNIQMKGEVKNNG